MSDMKASVETLADGFNVNGFEELKYGELLCFSSGVYEGQD